MTKTSNWTRSRIGVAIFFFVNGFLFASWSSRMPDLRAVYGVSEQFLGTMLLISAIGAVIAMPFAGGLSQRYGSSRIAIFSGVLYASITGMIAIYPSVLIACIVFFIMGLIVGVLDVAINSQAVAVEKDMGQPLMSSFHAVFSIGMAIGAACSYWITKLGIGLPIHMLCAAGVMSMAQLWASRRLQDEETETVEKQKAPNFILPNKAILPIGFIAFCGMLGEGTMSDWTALYMHDIVGQPKSFSSLSVFAFGTAMTIGRFMGDGNIKRFGARKLLAFNAILAIAGLCVALLFPHKWLALLGFFIIGLGLSTIVPIVYSKSGNMEGIPASNGIAMATTIGYSGFFVGPPIIGFIAGTYNLAYGFLIPLLLFVIMLVLILKFIKKE